MNSLTHQRINVLTHRLGFTLLELLVVVAILGMVMVGVTQMLAATLSGASKNNALQSVKEKHPELFVKKPEIEETDTLSRVGISMPFSGQSEGQKM